MAGTILFLAGTRIDSASKTPMRRSTLLRNCSVIALLSANAATSSSERHRCLGYTTRNEYVRCYDEVCAAAVGQCQRAPQRSSRQEARAFSDQNEMSCRDRRRARQRVAAELACAPQIPGEAQSGPLTQKKMAVALARQLAIDLWRWRTGRATAAELGFDVISAKRAI